MSQPQTLFEKIWHSHLVDVQDDGICILYIDRQLLHEVLSPQAFEGLRLTGRTVRQPNATLAVADHNRSVLLCIRVRDRIAYRASIVITTPVNPVISSNSIGLNRI